jgi:hypothetical protein
MVPEQVTRISAANLKQKGTYNFTMVPAANKKDTAQFEYDNGVHLPQSLPHSKLCLWRSFCPRKQFKEPT